MISMDGFDCAGHPGEADVGNWVLFPKAARELKIPFVASGIQFSFFSCFLQMVDVKVNFFVRTISILILPRKNLQMLQFFHRWMWGWKAARCCNSAGC